MIIGSGGLKNNLNAFGGGQHKLPEQKRQLETYFSVQYFGVKCGSLLARLIFPMIRADVKCFGNEDCYSISFGVPAVIMLFATIIFLIGTPKYKILKPNGNMIVKVSQCIKCAITEKNKNNVERKRHWLDYAEEKFGKKLVRETRIALKVILVSLPAPIFWSGLMQQRSRWIFQATKMNGDLGWYTIKPDQMIVINSLMAVTMIPILDKFVYPLLAKVGIKSMLQRLTLGGILIVIAFLLSSILEIQTQKMYLSILWQLPQYFVIGTAEILTYLSHLNFAYKEAPPSMKPVMMSLLYLSMAGGDLVVAIFSSLALFPSQAFEYAFYSALVLVAVIILIILANRYENTRLEVLSDDDEAAQKALTAKEDVENATENVKLNGK